MRYLAFSLKLISFSCLLLIADSVSVTAQEKGASARICVVAVHDSSLFTFCPPAFRKSLADGLLKKLPPPGDAWHDEPWRSGFRFGSYLMFISWDGRLGFMPYSNPIFPEGDYQRDFRWSGWLPPAVFQPDPGILERNRPDWLQLSKLTSGVCPSGWIDPDMAKEIGDEIRKNRDYVLVNDVDDSDLVLLVESLYSNYLSPVDGNWLSYSLNDETAGGQKHFCIVAIAVVVPVEIYRENPLDAGALLAGRLWAGVSFYKNDIPVPGVWMGGIRGLPSGQLGGRTVYDGSAAIHSASPKELVGKFFKKQKWSADIPPIVPAWSMSPLAEAQAVSAKPALKTDDVVQPSLPSDIPTAASKPVFRANTTLVSVPVVVQDMEGRFVLDLEATDFHVYENGVEQTIDRLISESAPFQTALMVDISHSTGLVQSAFEAAALTFAKVLRPEDKLMVLSFTNKIFVESELSGDQDQLNRAITHMRAHSGGTAYFGEDLDKRAWDPTRQMGTRLYDAVDLVVTERFDKLSGRKAILIFTDGVDSGSRLASLQSTLARIEESDVLAYAIHFDTPMQTGINRDRTAGMVAAKAQGAEYLLQLAEHSGGRFFKASTDAGFKEAFSYIAEEMGHQYTLYYYPKERMNDTAFRRIQVTVDKPGIRVRARAGYRPSPNASAADRLK
jgi:VWFA-related protein